MRPKEAVIAVTYRCNARCQMCNIWKSEATHEMEPIHYLKLPSSLKTINITGGEPFLRKDLIKVVGNIHTRAPTSRMVFSTNGLLTETIVSAISEIRRFHRKVGVGISVDGPEEIHDGIRGVRGAFKRAISTIEGLKKVGVMDLRIGMTLTNQNVGYAAAVYEIARGLGVEFSTTFAHNSEIYFQKMDNSIPEFNEATRLSLERVRSAQLRSNSVKDWFRAYHVQGIMDPNLRKEFIARCEAGSRYFFMSPSGDVFPCLVMNIPMGNLREAADWNDLLKKGVEEKTHHAVLRCTEDCWMVCNTRSLIMSHPVRASIWVAKNKMDAHLRPS